MEDSALTPQIVARIVLKEQKEALAREARTRILRKSLTQIYVPYERPEVEMSAGTTHSASCGTTTVADEHEEGEITEKEKEDSNTLTTNASSLRNSLTSPSSSDTPITPTTCVPEKPSSVNELCPVFTTIGTCTAICPHIHDPAKLALCDSRIQGLTCVKTPTCRQSHVWSFNNAPTCANFLMTKYCVRGNLCGFAHNDKVFPRSIPCEAFSKLGYCERGGECSRIHWFNFKINTDHGVQILQNSMQEEDVDAKMKATKARVLQNKKARRETRDAEKAKRLTFNDDMWAKEPEEFLTSSEANGDLALQEDFVPF